MNTQIVVITGPTGSGKSTVSLALAKKLDRCVYLEIDHIKHMIISGFVPEITDAGTQEWQYNEWAQVGESIGVLCQNFIERNFSVIISGYMYLDGWNKLQELVKPDSKILLLPSKVAIKIRDTERDSKYYMGESAIAEHYSYIESSDLFNDFVKIDSSTQTVDETVNAILNHISMQSVK